MNLTGAKPISIDGSSGGSTVLVDGKPVSANTMLALQCVGKKIHTVESLGGDEARRRAAAFVHHDASQCGFCTPGFVVAVRAFLDKNPKATEAEIRAGLERQPLPLRHLRQHHSGGPRSRERRLAMAEYAWPDRKDDLACSARQSRQDRRPGQVHRRRPSTATTSIPPKMLLARVLGCPHAHCKIKSIDISRRREGAGRGRRAADARRPGDEIHWQGDLIAVRGRRDRRRRGRRPGGDQGRVRTARRVRQRTKIWKPPKPPAAPPRAAARCSSKNEPGDDDDEDDFDEKEIERLFKEAAAVVEGHYGIHAITHMCLEPHGSTCEWKDGKLTAHLSTQNVSGTAGQFASPLGITADDVTVHCDFIGGGFGSKFAADRWGVLAAKLAKELGRPVKLMLDRDLELKIAGCRPSGFVDVKVGADKDGVVTVWDSHHWGTGGIGGGGVSQDVIPYVFVPPNFRRRVTAHQDQHRSPRGPGGRRTIRKAVPCRRRRIDDIAAKLGLDSYDVFLRNLVERVQRARPTSTPTR